MCSCVRSKIQDININGNFWFAITDYQNLNEVRVVDVNGNELGIYKVGQNPGDFAICNKNE